MAPIVELSATGDIGDDLVRLAVCGTHAWRLADTFAAARPGAVAPRPAGRLRPPTGRPR